MKYKQGGRKGFEQASRFVASTIVGEGLDSLIFMSVGFAGVLPTADIIKTILTIWAVKVLYEVILLPVSMNVSNWVKRVEGLDSVDSPDTTDYNPFKL
jgi:queuosine precursor transporter